VHIVEPVTQPCYGEQITYVHGCLLLFVILMDWRHGCVQAVEWRMSYIMRVTAALFVVFATILSGCGGDDNSQPAATIRPPAETVRWGYEGDVGPEHWAEISEEYRLCADGEQQSPIDIAAALVQPAPYQIHFEYKPSALNILNNGDTIRVNYDAGSTIDVEGERFQLLQFHLHAGSEHTLDEQRFPAELHLVHQSENGDLAVVGVWITEGAENLAMQAVIENMPVDVSEEPTRIAGITVDAGNLLPDDRDVFEYSGSLTTPPCTEGVRWFVMAHPIELSP
jgi:carbonic anhydrase